MKKILFFISLFIFVNPLFSIVFVPAVQTYQCQNKPLVYSHTVNPYCGTTECYAYDSSNPVFTSGQAHCVSDTLVAVQKLVKNNNVSPWPSYPYCACNVTEYYYAVTSCPTGQVVVDGICKAPQCPSGKILDASGKYCVPQTCPIGSTRDPHTLHCLPTKCPEGQTLISDGTCQTSCPPNSSRVDKICRYDCGHWDKATCGKYFDSQGNKCVWGLPLGLANSSSPASRCMTESQQEKIIDDVLDGMPLGRAAAVRQLVKDALPKIFGEPEYPQYEPQPLKPYEPAKPVIPKPINDPDYIPPVTPTPIEPIPFKPVEPEPLPTKPANDPDYVPTIDPVTPLTPDIVPYVPPVPAPAPVPKPSPAPLPAPVPLPAPAPSPVPTPSPSPSPLPSPAPAPSPSPLPSPAPAPSPSPAPLPMPKPDYTYDPVPETPPVIDPVPAPAPSTVPDVNMPNVNMPPIPDILDFSIDDMDKFRYNATTMSYNILDQVDNVQNTFTNTMNILNNGFPPVVLPSGSCGSSMSFGFYGKEIDLCPPLANTSAQFAPLFQLLIFLVGLIASIKIFMIGLRD